MYKHRKHRSKYKYGGEKISMSKKEFMEEHHRLTKVLKSPSHKDDKQELKRQQKEMKKYSK